MEELVMRKPMGRPPRGFIRTSIWLPERIGRRIDAVLEGKEKRADVIRQGLVRELERREAESAKKKPGRK